MLLALDAAVAGDTAPSMLEGVLAVGIDTADRTDWWVIELGKTVRTRLDAAPPARADGILRLSVSCAQHIVRYGRLPADQSGWIYEGDHKLLDSFARRYLLKVSWLNIRMGSRHANQR